MEKHTGLLAFGERKEEDILREPKLEKIGKEQIVSPDQKYEFYGLNWTENN